MLVSYWWLRGSRVKSGLKCLKRGWAALAHASGPCDRRSAAIRQRFSSGTGHGMGDRKSPWPPPELFWKYYCKVLLPSPFSQQPLAVRERAAEGRARARAKIDHARPCVGSMTQTRCCCLCLCLCFCLFVFSDRPGSDRAKRNGMANKSGPIVPTNCAGG